MLRILKIKLSLPKGMKANQSMGSVLHGALMEKLTENTAAELHEQGSRPFSQGVYFSRKNQCFIWQINFLEDSLYEQLREFLQTGQMIYLRQKDASITCREVYLAQQVSYESLADQVFLSAEPPVGGEFQFITTTSFKREGRYVITPEPFLLIQNLLNRWNRYSLRMEMEEEDLAEKLSNACQLSRYNLRSQVYSVEHSNVYGFAGKMRLQYHGTEMMNRLLGILTLFAPYAGIGIKTALGMGVVDTKIYHYQKQ